MNREQLTEAVHDLAFTALARQYALEHAMALLSLNQLQELFDTVADHHDLMYPKPRGRTPRNPRLDGRR